MNRPLQKLPNKQKNVEWVNSCVNYYINNHHSNIVEIDKMRENYSSYNGDFTALELEKYCGYLNIIEQDLPNYVTKLNLSHNIINELKGQELSRPFKYDIINNSLEELESLKKSRDADLQEFISKEISKSIQLQSIQSNLNDELEKGNINEAQYKKLAEKFAGEIEQKFSNGRNAEEIVEYYKRVKTKKELTIKKLFEFLKSKYNFDTIKNNGMEDLLVAGKEIIEVVERDGEFPMLRELNPLRISYVKSPDEMYIQNSEAVVYLEYIKRSAFEERFKLSIDQLEDGNISHSLGNIFGVDPNRPFRGFTFGEYENFEKRNDPYLGNKSHRQGDALSGSSSMDFQDNIELWTVYWRSMQLVGILTEIDEQGEVLEINIVDEDYPIPADAKHKIEKDQTIFYFSKFEYNYTLTYKYIPQIWKGYKTNNVKVEFIEAAPLSNNGASLINGYDVKIPIYGAVLGGKNGGIVSLYDRIASWQRQYDIVAAKLLKAIGKDYGTMTALNVQMFQNKNMTFQQSLQMGIDTGFLPFNPNTNDVGVQLGSPSPIDKKIDATAPELSRYIEILSYLESKMATAAGLSMESLGKSQQYVTASSVEKANTASLNIVEPIFQVHESLWKEIYQGYIESVVYACGEKDNVIRSFLSHNEYEWIELEELTPFDHFEFHTGNNSKNNFALRTLYNYLLPLIQNDKADFSTVISLLKADSLDEFELQVKEMEDKLQKRGEQMQAHEQDMLQKKLDADKEDREDNQAHELEMKMIELKEAEIRSMGYLNEADVNSNSIPDILESEYLKQDADKLRGEQQIREKEFELKKEIETKKSDNELEKLKLQRQVEANKRIALEKNNLLKEKEIEAKIFTSIINKN